MRETRATLVPVDGLAAMPTDPDRPSSVHKHVVQDYPVFVGRAKSADVAVRDPTISRLHCRIDDEDGTLVVRDLRSSNGTFVNGCRVRESPLMPGDVLGLGSSAFRVAYDRGSLEDPPDPVYGEQPVRSRRARELGEPERADGATIRSGGSPSQQ